jgi:anaerobic dimethyl sulfoxide reductase subunit B (iron-sulfur subunit)
MKQMGFYFDQTRCIGCYTCSVACKDWYDIPAHINLRKIKIIEEGVFPNLNLNYLSFSCYHCKEPPCVKACPVKAINKREKDGIVIVESNKCLGNEECDSKCLKACPYDIPQFGSGRGEKMQKCNFCLERLEGGKQAICVEACPMYALDAGPLEQLREKYGNIIEAEGFKYFNKFKPSIIFKPKLKNLD